MSVLDRRGNLKSRRAAGRVVELLRKGQKSTQQIKTHCSLSNTFWLRCRDILLDMKLMTKTSGGARGHVWELTQTCVESFANGGRADDLIGLADRSYGSALWGAVNNLDDRLSILEAILADDMGDPVWVNLLTSVQAYLGDMSDENLLALEHRVEDIVPQAFRLDDEYNNDNQKGD